MKYKKMIAAIVIAASITAVIVSLLLPKIYKAQAVIIPVSSKGGGGGLGALASQFGGLASLAGLSLSGAGGDAQKITAILKSRTLTENVINREQLMPILFEKLWDSETGKWKTADPEKMPNMEKAVKGMKGAVVITDDKKAKTIKISGAFKGPQVAARVVNAYVDELQNFISSNAFTTAKRNRIFIEGQLAQNKRDLLEAGKEINEFYKGSRVSASEAKVDVLIGTGNRGPGTGNLEPGIRNQEPGTSMASFDFPGPRSQVPGSESGSELDSILSQKTAVEMKIAEARVVKNVPQQVYLTYLMLRRELLAKVNALLTTQYEMAKIEETKEDLTFQIIDKAVPPVKRSRPKRSQICIMSFMAALFAAIFLAFFREYIKKMKAMHKKQAA